MRAGSQCNYKEFNFKVAVSQEFLSKMVEIHILSH